MLNSATGGSHVDRNKKSTVRRLGMAMRWVIKALLIGVLATPLGGPVAAEERVALVIGNGAYRHTAALPNPANDATAVAAALERLDFTVALVVDGDKTVIADALRKFARSLRGADVGLFYYAGHGLQVDGSNYLVPIDAQLLDEADLEFEAINVDQILRLMEKSSPVNLLFLDACRDNPMAQSLATSMRTRSTTVGRGLAVAEGATGTLIVYATRPGHVAEDGAGSHSPFTAALLQHIETAGIEVRQMLSRVRDAVLRATNEKQQPWDHSSLRGDFYFRPLPATVSVTPPEPAPEPLLADKEALFWHSIKDSGNPEDFEAYLAQFPAGTFAALARNRIKALRSTQPVEIAATEAQTAGQPEQSAALAIPDPAALEAAERALNLGRDQRQRVQRALTLLGFDTNGVDGAFGARTREAISAWQGSQGSARTGYLDPGTYQDLLAQAQPQLAAWDKEEAERRQEEARVAELQRVEEEKRQEELRKIEAERLRREQQAAVSAASRYAGIFEAARAGDALALKGFVAAGHNVNATNTAKATPLHSATLADSKEAILVLVNAGAELGARDIMDRTALDYAVLGRLRRAEQTLRALAAPCSISCR
jgi:peptidoglycan hydrolase-like protein with peptidoglycan-binding domain